VSSVTQHRVFGLDVMRAAAIGLVLFNHTALFFHSGTKVFGVGLVAGYLGVELFFVLSGFLIGGILLQLLDQDCSAGSLKDFWIRRWFRTLPNYVLFLAINVVLAIWLGRAAVSLWPYFLFFQNLIGPPKSFFIESWSLAVEEWFYVLLPFFLVVAAKLFRRPWRTQSLFVILIGIIVVTCARGIYVETTNPVWLTDVRMIVPFRLDACMFGVLGAWCKYFYPDRWQRAGPVLFAAGLFLLAAVFAAPFVLSGEPTLLTTGGFTVTSLGALLLLPQLDRWKSASEGFPAAVKKISIWSYSLYLVNLPVYAVLHYYWEKASPFFLGIAFLICSISISAAIYRFYERPMMDLRERWPFRRTDHLPSTRVLPIEG
jgi:peptidoglycan/LPS O-acetylase OafA/YrhL